MSVVKEAYGYGASHCKLTYRYAITNMPEEDSVLIESVEYIMNKAFYAAEAEIEKELYKRGLMTCNAYLYRIDDMRVNGNYLVQDYIKELDAKYKEN